MHRLTWIVALAVTALAVFLPLVVPMPWSIGTSAVTTREEGASTPTSALAEAPLATGQPTSRALLPQPLAEPVAIIRVRGRCVEAGTRAPIPGCRVAVREGFTQVELNSVAAGADGRFELDSLRSCELRLMHPRYADAYRSIRWHDSEDPLDLGDLELAHGFEVRGRVVDSAGLPAAGVELHLEHDEDVASADTDGTFLFQRPVAEGDWKLSALSAPGSDPQHDPGAALTVRSPEFIQVHGGPPPSVTVVVDRRRTISAGGRRINGRILDEAGQPAHRVSVRALAEGGTGTVGFGYADVKGRFELEASPDSPSVHLSVEGTGEYQPLTTDRVYAWGETDVEFRVRRAFAIPIEVVEAATGRPVEWFSADCGPAWANGEFWGAAMASRAARGRIEVGGAWRCANTIRVFPRSPQLRGASITVPAADGPPKSPVGIALQPAPMVTVRTLDAGGRPLAGAKVTLVDLNGNALPGSGRDLALLMHHVGRGPVTCSCIHAIDERASDAAGFATLGGLDPGAHFVVVVEASGHEVLAQPEIQLPGGSSPLDLRLVPLPVAGTVTVRLRGAKLPAELMHRLVLIESDRRGLRDCRWIWLVATTPVVQVATSVPPGAWALELLVCKKPWGSLRWKVVARDRVPVAAGERVTLDVDVQEFAPASVAGTVTVDDRVPEHAVLQIVRREPPPVGLEDENTAVVRPRGAFHFANLCPGRYDVTLLLNRWEEAEQRVEAAEPLRVGPGASSRPVLQLRRHRLSLRLLAADGVSPVAHRPVRLCRPDHGPQCGDCQFLTTDADGTITLAAGPLSPKSLYVDREVLGRFDLPDAEGALQLGPVQVDPNRPETSLVLRLPAR